MLLLEAKLNGKTEQYNLIDQAIRTALFCRNKALRYWMDNHGTDKYDLNKHMPSLAKESDFTKKLNSQARQASTEGAWSALVDFLTTAKRKYQLRRGSLKKVWSFS